jgi:3-hydroxyisobutyrate dehydrogenase-like beta-hydroxyacid dehydrogenase
MSGCGARTAAGSLKAVFESSDVERFDCDAVITMLANDYAVENVVLGIGVVSLKALDHHRPKRRVRRRNQLA